MRARFAFSLMMATVAALVVQVGPACAYEEDTHFTVCYVACRAAGFSEAEALTIARTDQGMDDSDGTAANHGVLPQTTEELFWHAFGYNLSGAGQAPMILERKRALFEWALKGTNNDEKLKRMGVFFHYQQDRKSVV